MKTMMWYVGAIDNVVCVSDNPNLIKHIRVKMRSISPRAAARKYIRNNLAWNRAKAEYEIGYSMSRDTPSRNQIKSCKYIEKMAKIRILEGKNETSRRITSVGRIKPKKD